MCEWKYSCRRVYATLTYRNAHTHTFSMKPNWTLFIRGSDAWTGSHCSQWKNRTARHPGNGWGHAEQGKYDMVQDHVSSIPHWSYSMCRLIKIATAQLTNVFSGKSSDVNLDWLTENKVHNMTKDFHNNKGLFGVWLHCSTWSWWNINIMPGSDDVVILIIALYCK